jgi:membrane-bound lytic murein transglycosylase A
MIMHALLPLLRSVVISLSAATLLAACVGPQTLPPAPAPAPTQCPALVCPGNETAPPSKPAAKPLLEADWADLPGWVSDDLSPAYRAFRQSCPTLLRTDKRRALWAGVCAPTQQPANDDSATVRAWFEQHFRPWSLRNADGSANGLITGYYEPIIKGRRTTSADFRVPVFAAPDDLITVDLGELYPELRNLRLRGRLDATGRKLIPYFTRSEWSAQETRRAAKALLWTDDALDYFFLQIQGSGQVVLDDGSRLRIGYADQNGQPYKSIGKWLLDQGELAPGTASMQGIKAWAKANPKRLNELLNANPSVVFFRELPATGSGPPGALGVPLTPARSMAIDPRHIPLGAPVFLATTEPNSDAPLQRLMLAQDTGGAIRGVVRGDFYWGSGAEAGAAAGRMKQSGSTWLLLPRDKGPDDVANLP